MAQNDALTFNVKFIEDPNQGIEDLSKQLEKKLKGITIKLDAKNIDVTGVSAQFTNVFNEIKKGFEELGKSGSSSGLSGLGKTISGVVENLSTLSSELVKLNSGLSTSLTNAITEAMKNSSGAIKDTIQEVNNLKNALDDVTSKVVKSVGQASKNVKNDSVGFFPVADKGGMINAYAKAIDEVTEKLEKARARQVNFSDIQDVNKITTVYQMWGREIQNLENQLNSLYQAMGKATAMRGFYEILAPISKPYSKEERSYIKKQLNFAFSQPKYDLSGIEKARQAYSEVSGKAKELYDVMMRLNSTPALKHLADSGSSLFERLKAARQELMNISTTGKTSKGLSGEDFLKSFDFKTLSNDLAAFITNAKSRFKELDRAAAESKKKIEQTQTKNNKNSAEAELKRLKNLLQEINAIQAKSPKLQIEGLDKAKQELQALIDLMNRAKKEGTSISGIDMGRWSAGNANLTIAELTQNQHSAATAAAQHTQAQQRMEQAIASATGKAQQQSQVLSDLRSMAAQYLSVWGATSFIKEIAQITGELELQQRSLEVIIGSAGQAQEMFNNIKGLSQMSPFTFQDLLKSTRQLAAFGVETKDLYGTMKSLSDLGAGLNVDVQRLILAYGHVKSAGVLSGIQRRQFETAGINITGEIAKLYNQRYERAGSDERVTNADIFKKITKREIGFEDVEEAIRNLTSEGGKFYNMQLRQYETLGGKLRNLRNNYNIMLDDIGKRYMEVFTSGVDALNSMMENWRTWGALIKSVTAALVAAKVASLALGKSWASMSAARNAARRMRYEAQAMAFTNRTGEIAPLGATAQAATRFNWKFWQGQQRAMLPPSYAPSVISAEGLNKFQKLRMALHKDVASFDRAWIAQQLGYGQQYQKHIAGLNGWRLGMERMKVSAQSFFTTMRAGFVSIATNPMMWIGAAIAGITALVNKANEIETAMEHSTENTKRIMKEDIENINSSLNPIKNSLFDDNGNFNKEALDKRGFQATFEELDEIMQNHDPLYKGHLFDLKQMGDESAIIKGMIQDIEDARTGKEMLEHNVGAVNATNADTGYNGTIGTLGIGTQWSTFTEKMHEADLDFQKFKSRLILDSEEIEAALKEKLPNVYKQWKSSGMEFEDFMTQLAVNIKKPGLFDNPSKVIEAFANNSSLEKFRKSLSDLVNDLDGAKNKVKDVAAAIAKGFDPSKTLGANVEYLDAQIKDLFSQEGSEVKDPEMQQYFVDLILANLPDDSFAPQIRQHLYETILKANLSEAIQSAIKDGSVDPNNIDANALADIESRFNVMAEKLIGQNPDKKLREALKIIGQNIFKDFKANPAPAIREFDRSWQKVYNAITDPNDPRKKLIAKFETIFKNSVSDYEFWAAIDKEVKSIKERLAQMRNVYTVLQTIKIKPEMLFDSRTIQKQIDDIVREMTRKLQSKDYVGLKEMNEYVQGLAAMRDIFKAAEKSNRSLGTEDREKYENKQAKAAEKAQKAREAEQRRREAADRKAKAAAEKSRTEAERKEQKEWDRDLKNRRDMVGRLEEARREYKTWLEKGANEANAAAKVIDTFKEWGLVGKGKLFEESDLKDINNYDKILDKIKAKIDEMKPRSKKEGRAEQLDDLYQLLAKAQTNLETTIFDEHQADILSEMESTIERLTKKWEIYNSVLEKTGDANLAGTLADLSELDRGYDRLKGSLEEYIDRYVSMYMQNAPMEPQTISSLRRVDFSKVINLDEKGIERYVRDTFGVLGEEGSLEMIERVKPIVALVKSYKKASDSSHKSAIDAYSNAISSAMDYESQIQRVNSKLKDQIRLINSLDELTPEQKHVAIEIETSRAEIKKLELGGSYKKFFDGIFDEPMSQLEAMRRVLEGAYARALRSGAISAEEYAKKIEEIDKVMREATIKNPEAWWNKGFFDTRTQEQRQNEMRDRGNALYRQGSDLYQQALQNGDQKGAKDALDMMSKGKQMVDGANKAAEAMAIIDKVVHGVDKAIQGTVKAFGYLKGALDALGMESDTMAAIGDYLNALGEMSSHVAASWDSFKSGDYVGASVEAFGAITSLITGFAQAHDNAIQRSIDHIKEDTTKMSNTLDTIRSLRERELGYDRGQLRAGFASMYATGGNSAQSAMYDYYSRYSNGSGYEQELRLLEEQRQKIMEMYNLENSKKKKNKEELEDYKKQIAELDEQIAFFVEDLANELWGIDLKGWAEQLGDALMTAFENGTSAASAFKDTVQDIMRNVVKNMLTVGVVEPALEKLRVRLFGKDGNGGVFKGSQENIGAVLSELGNWFENEGPALMDAANEFYNGADNMMRQILGYGMRESEKSTSAVSSITSTASEETMGIVAGYLSRLSQDVSVQRIMQEMFVNGSWPDYVAQVTSANDSLSAIDRSTAAMMEMMRDGNGALYERVENMSRRLDNFANGVDTITMR